MFVGCIYRERKLPRGTDICIIGVLERDDTPDLIQRHGGAVTQSVNKKTSYALCCGGTGESKLSKVRGSLEKDLLYFNLPTEHSQIVSCQKSMYTDAKAQTKQFSVMWYHPIEVTRSCLGYM